MMHAWDLLEGFSEVAVAAWSSVLSQLACCRPACRELEPQEGHPVLSVSWSPSGDQFMVVTGSPRSAVGLCRAQALLPACHMDAFHFDGA
eukprot:1158105-Pelagomonas_calceolata.AAC.6